MFQRNIGKETTIHHEGDFSAEEFVRGKLVGMENCFFVEGYCNPIPMEDISSAREGKRLDVKIKDSNYFRGGLLN